MPRAFTFLWRWSWVATAPLTLLGLVWLLPAWRDARQFLVWHPASMHRSSDIDLDLRQILLARLAALREDALSSWKSRWNAPASPLARLDLEVAPANLARLNDYLPRSGKESFVLGLLRYPDGNFEKVGVRYRGDSLHHWGLAAKSWLVRTSKTRPLAGQRRWHLILPRWRSTASYYVNLHLAARMGVLAADATPVDLRVNGRQHGGIHLLQAQQDDSFLHAHHFPPADLYVGDMTPFDTLFYREMQHGGLWELPWLWTKSVADRKDRTDSRLPLETLFYRLYRGGDEELLELLDLPAWAEFSAYMQLFAGNHIEMGHNWKLLYDPARLAFVPLVGDGNGLPDDVLDVTRDFPGRDVSITTPLLARLHRNHEFLRLKNEAVARFYREQLDQAFFSELHHFQQLISPTLAIYPQLDWIGTVAGQPIHYFDDAALARRIATVTPALSAWFAAQRENQILRPAHVQAALLDAHTLRVSVDGYASARVGLHLPLGATLTGARLRITRADGRVETADVTPWLSPRDGTTWLDWPLLAQRQVAMPRVGTAQPEHLVLPATYDLILDGIGAAQVTLLAVGDLGEPIAVPLTAALPKVPLRDDNAGLLPAARPTVQWHGEVTLNGVTDLRGTLEIAAGTRIRLGPGATVVARGRVTARGTPEQPVVFERLDPHQPWGALALVGAGAAGSSLEHCVLRGGNGSTSPLARFSGMLSLHGVPEIRLAHVRLEGGAAPAQLHSLRSNLTLEGGEFLDAGQDSLSVDFSTARVQAVRILRASRHGLAATTSDVILSGSLVAACREAGLSATAEGRLVALDVRLEANRTGLLAGDGAAVALYNATLVNNVLQLSGEHKSQDFPSITRLVLAKSALAGGDRAVALRDHSTLEIWDSTLPAGLWAEGLTVDAASSPSLYPASAAATPALGQLLPGGHWSQAEPRRRGSTQPAAPILNPP